MFCVFSCFLFFSWTWALNRGHILGEIFFLFPLKMDIIMEKKDVWEHSIQCDKTFKNSSCVDKVWKSLFHSSTNIQSNPSVSHQVNPCQQNSLTGGGNDLYSLLHARFQWSSVLCLHVLFWKVTGLLLLAHVGVCAYTCAHRTHS